MGLLTYLKKRAAERQQRDYDKAKNRSNLMARADHIMNKNGWEIEFLPVDIIGDLYVFEVYLGGQYMGNAELHMPN